MQVLLVALGRMGCRYKEALERHFSQDLHVVTVDPRVPEPQSVTEHYTCLEEVPADRAFDLAIDARPNQDRLGMFRQFLQRQIPHVVIEKPHATSLAESQEMLALMRAQARPPKVLMPFYERYGRQYLPETLDQLNAGALKSVVISAGAIGLGCNGIHYLDLANHLFGGVPDEVYARLLPDTVPSPRGAQFSDHAGTILAHYPTGDLVLTMRPDSSVGSNITLVYEHGKIQILEQIEMAWHWYRQPVDTWADPAYRTHREGRLEPPCDFEKDLVDHMIPAGLRDLLSGGRYPSIEDGHAALRLIALAMASHLERRPVGWHEADSLAERLSFQFT